MVAARDEKDIKQSTEVEARARIVDAKHEEAITLADAYWKQKASSKDWNCVVADPSVYRYCGKKVTKDRRQDASYRKKVVDGLGLGEGKVKEGLSKEDMDCCREGLLRKAAAFWVDDEDSPRTALR